MSRVSLLHPTRGRGIEVLEAYDYRMKRASGKHELEYIFAVDEDDRVGIETVTDICKGGNARFVVVTCDDGPRFCHILAINVAYRNCTGDHIVHGDDDLRCPKLWDNMVVQAMPDPTVPQLLGVGDPHWAQAQWPSGDDADSVQYQGDGMVSSFIMTRAYAERQGGFVAYPEYDGMLSDFDLTQKAALDDALVDRYQDITFSHHWKGGDNPDAIALRHVRRDCWLIGANVYARRSLQALPDVKTKEPHRWGHRNNGLWNWDLEPVRPEPNTLRWCLQNQQWTEARSRLRELLDKYHWNACGGRFRFHVGVQLWNECSRQLGDLRVMDVEDRTVPR